MLSRWVGTLQDSGRKLQGQLAESGQRLQTTLRESGREIQTKIEEAREQFQVEERARAARVHRAQRLQQMKQNAIVPPWHCEEDGERRGELKRQIFALSADEGLFLKEPSTAIPFDIGVASMFAEVPLAEDRNLSQLRFRLVPRRISDETFFRNYFAAVNRIRQSLGVPPLILDFVVDAGGVPMVERTLTEPPGVDGSPGQEVRGAGPDDEGIMDEIDSLLKELDLADNTSVGE